MPHLIWHIGAEPSQEQVELLDRDGAAFGAYRYDEWGNPTGTGSHATGIWTQSTSLINATLAAQIASRQLLRYAGYAWDTHSELYYCSARYYDPASYQWTSKDEVKADGEESAYQYCGGDAVGRVDPSGHAQMRIRFPRPPSNKKPIRCAALLKRVLMVNAGHAQQVLADNMDKYGLELGTVRTWFWWGLGMVRGGRPWDLKLAARESSWRTQKYLKFGEDKVSPEQFGNIHIGYTGAAIGLPFYANDAGNTIAGYLHREVWRTWNNWVGEFKNAIHDAMHVTAGYVLYARWGVSRQSYWVRW